MWEGCAHLNRSLIILILGFDGGKTYGRLRQFNP